MEKSKKILASIKEKPYFLEGNFVLYKDDCLKILEQLPENLLIRLIIFQMVDSHVMLENA